MKLRLLRPNFTQVSLTTKLGSALDLYFSYETLVAFRSKGSLYVSENQWTRTTGKHLTQEFGAMARTKANDFNAKADHLMELLGGIDIPFNLGD